MCALNEINIPFAIEDDSRVALFYVEGHHSKYKQNSNVSLLCIHKKHFWFHHIVLHSHAWRRKKMSWFFRGHSRVFSQLAWKSQVTQNVNSRWKCQALSSSLQIKSILLREKKFIETNEQNIFDSLLQFATGERNTVLHIDTHLKHTFKMSMLILCVQTSETKRLKPLKKSISQRHTE